MNILASGRKRKERRAERRKAADSKPDDSVKSLQTTQVLRGQGTVTGTDETRSSIRIAETAVRNNYPITDEIRQKVVETMFGVLSEPMANAREKTAAARVIVTADRADDAKNRKPPEAPETQVNVNVGVGINVTPEQRRDRVASLRERLRHRGIVGGEPQSGGADPPRIGVLPDSEGADGVEPV